MTSPDQDARHTARMVRKKAVIDARIAAAQDARGVLLVNTGNGKGKSSAAFGVVARDAAAAQAAWAIAATHLADPATDLVVLDEMTYAFKYGWLDLPAVLAAFAARPRPQHVIVTGRAAPAALIDAADTVTEMAMVKHAFQAGVPAMPGLEW